MNSEDLASKSVLERILLALLSLETFEAPRNSSPEDDRIFVDRIRSELGVGLTTLEFKNGLESGTLAETVHRKLPKDANDRTIVDYFQAIELLAKEEIHGDVILKWDGEWFELAFLGNYLTAPDSLDFVETFMRIEEDFNVMLIGPEQDQLELLDRTVGETIKAVWKKTNPPV